MPLYFLSAIAYFWIPVLFLAPRVLPKLDPVSRRAFWLCLAIFYPLAAGMEYVYLHYDIWTFSERVDPLLGLRIYGAPIEEFVYWFGAVPFALLVYMSFCRVFPVERTPAYSGRRQGRKKRPLIALPARRTRPREVERVPLFER